MRKFRLLAVVSLVALSLALVWVVRRPLSEAAVARWFAGQQVEARYRITEISTGGVSLTDIAIGPLAHPDFTAERIDVAIGWSPLRPRLDRVTLVRPLLRVTLSGRGISLGSVDRLIPTSIPSQRLPDIDVRIIGGALQVATPGGGLRGRFDGGGRLRDGFTGQGRIEPATLAMAGCTIQNSGAGLQVATTRDATRVAVQGVVPKIACATPVSAEALRWNIIATLPPTLDRYTAIVEASLGPSAIGSYRAGALALNVNASAPMLQGRITGLAEVIASGVRGPKIAARSASFRGSYGLAPTSATVDAAGLVAIAGGLARVDPTVLRRASRAFDGTLVGRLRDAFVARGTAAARLFDASARVAISVGKPGTSGKVSALSIRSASGAKVSQTGSLTSTTGTVALDGGFVVSGGGLPRLSLDGKGQLTKGHAALTVAPWVVGNAAIETLRLVGQRTGGATVIDGDLRVSGPLGGGVTARGLGVSATFRTLPDGSAMIGSRCVAIGWRALVRNDLSAGPGAVRVCPTGGAIATLSAGQLKGGAVVEAIALRGQSGDAPVSLTTAPLRLRLSGASNRQVVTLAPARIAVGYGTRDGSGVVSGKVALASLAGSGRIDTVKLDDVTLPVIIDGASAAWRVDDRRIGLADGVARVTDRASPARFNPLRLDGVSAVVADGIVTAKGVGRLAATSAKLAGFSASHTFATGNGEATIDTGTLTFDAGLQPFQITENLRGIVDNVRGPIVGNGRFDWTADGLTSRGTLRIDHVSLATASLGPVDDIAGTLVFDDLLALTTPPEQTLTIKRINPGVAVEDGVIVFRMLAPDAAAIDSIRWPYAGGALTLAPVVIRAGDLRRDFVLVVDGLDAQQFLQKFEIKDVNVTGRFDGRLPLVFADGRGRIAAGRLVAREGGGLVQYVGAIGGEDLGAGARLAFDALRRLRYHELTLDLDGDLDGELVTQLGFSGTNETATTLGGGPLPIKATGLPFKFNVTVRAPFRALLGTAASFSDVRPLIRPTATGVQPQ